MFCSKAPSFFHPQNNIFTSTFSKKVPTLNYIQRRSFIPPLEPATYQKTRAVHRKIRLIFTDGSIKHMWAALPGQRTTFRMWSDFVSRRPGDYYNQMPNITPWEPYFYAPGSINTYEHLKAAMIRKIDDLRVKRDAWIIEQEAKAEAAEIAKEEKAKALVRANREKARKAKEDAKAESKRSAADRELSD